MERISCDFAELQCCTNIKDGDVVLLKVSHMKHKEWPMLVVTKTHIDKKIRMLELIISKGVTVEMFLQIPLVSVGTKL